ncbi:hypothetical protein ENSA5_64460 [Enhygromyxa salina]|uniref:Cytochrome c-552/4 domain-containing protein n=1 Tax=Enhygromyxa salina TaxID=215803 RepID=A0A2S9XCX6_9BACT|nr:multiheme c-type cytochrome [Enhygromyxa salina]PRP90531.1 hypothetical protein ENSA5_64460 [Enhygromyxa salina]
MGRAAGVALAIAGLVVALATTATASLAREDESSGESSGASQSAATRAFMPRPARGPRRAGADRLDRNDECVNCHADIAGEWSDSLHRRAFEDPMVQAAFAQERDPSFCRSCHAPEADPRREPSPREAALGVACVTCHLDGHDDVVLAGPEEPSRRAGPAPHPLRRTPAFASPDACAGCHEFWFPHAGRGGHKLKMQRTVTEHARSDHADDSCQTCHMPPRGSGAARHLDHGFAVAGQVQVLRSAVTVDASRPEPGRVVLELSPGRVGHAVPTGDLFRRLSVELRSDDDGPSWSEQRVLTRHFAAMKTEHGHVTRVERSDDRVGVGSGPRVVEFTLPPALHDRPLRWELVLERALDASTGRELRATVWDRTSFASGEL